MIAMATSKATPVCARSARLSLVALDKALIVARYGGEEFALLLPGLDIEHAVALAEEARRSIEELLMTHADSPCGIVTISIGVESRVPEPGQSAACLVEAADRALYMQKGAAATQ
jgi:diguanylate cyclase (GGDEF)-like protein